MESDPAEAALIALQCRFAQSIRDRGVTPAPGGVTDERMAVYRELFLANIESALTSAFPVATRLIDASTWQQMVSTFWREHPSQEPQYPHLSAEFVRWFEREAAVADGLLAGFDYPLWLGDLLTWEHAELASLLAEADAELATQNLLHQCPQVTCSLQIFQFDWPVHRIGPDYQPESAELTLLACYRKPNHDIDFMELSAPAMLLLSQLQSQPSLAGVEHIACLAAHMNLTPEAIGSFVGDFLEDLSVRGVIIGTRPKE